ncbi:MAG: Flp family type IVb pilin [Deltaproteobacteria bacterium]|nr:Flp family type IVb pilin [Deltaproteobacteria bacterium]
MHFLHDEGGTTAIEYALIASLFTMILAGALGPLRGGLVELWSCSEAMNGATN